MSRGRGGVETCRFFLQGKCKFGDKCRNYHPKGRDDRGESRSGYQTSRYDSRPSYRQGGSNRFALFSDWEGDGGSSGRGGGGGSRDQNYGGRGYRQDNYQDKYHYTSPSYQASQQQRRNTGGGSGSWRGGGGGRSGSWRGEKSDDTHGSGWRGGDRRDSRSGSTAPTTADIVHTVRHDMEESLSLWPLTCYGYSSYVRLLPDLVDVSPEELRVEAYRAKSSSSPDSYLRNLEETIRQQTSLKTKYASITEDQLESIISGMSGDQGGGLFGSLASSTTGPSSGTPLGLFGPTTTTGTGSSSMDLPASIGLFSSASSSGHNKSVSSVFPSAHQSSAAPSLFAAPSTPTSTGLSLFTSPAPSNPASVSTSSSTGATATSGSTSKLSKEDIEAFKADKFVLGKIPETAPPPELC